MESRIEFGHKVTELTILAQSVNGYFRCLALNAAGSDSDVKRVLILPPEGKVFLCYWKICFYSSKSRLTLY